MTPSEIRRVPNHRFDETVSPRNMAANATFKTTSKEIIGCTKLKSAHVREAAKSAKKRSERIMPSQMSGFETARIRLERI